MYRWEFNIIVFSEIFFGPCAVAQCYNPNYLEGSWFDVSLGTKLPETHLHNNQRKKGSQAVEPA
jgi:hypothetical protein